VLGLVVKLIRFGFSWTLRMLHEEAKVLSDQGLGNDGIKKWAKSCKVKYDTTTVDGEVRIKLHLSRDGNGSGI